MKNRSITSQVSTVKNWLPAVVMTLSLLAPVSGQTAPQCRVLVNSITQPTAPRAPRTEARNEGVTEPVRLTEAEVTREIQAQDKSLFRIDLQHFYESAVRFMQKHVTGSSVRSSVARERSRRMNMTYFLNAGKSNEAIDIYRRLFDDVELSYWVIKNSREQLETLPADSPLRFKLQRRIIRSNFRFAQNYGEYIGVRSYLEKMSEPGAAHPQFVEAAQKTLRALGVHKFSDVNPDFASLRIPEERVQLAEVKALFRSSAHYTRLKLYSDFKSEIASALRYFFSAEVIVGRIEAVLNKFPPATSDALKKVTLLARSAQMRQRTLPQLVEIEGSGSNVRVRLDMLRQKNTLTQNDELVVTYARTVEFTDGFNELKAEAKRLAEQPDNTIAKAFYDRMLAAEERASKMPDISLFEHASNIDVVLTLVQCGIIIKVAGPQVFHSTTEFLNFLVGVPFFGQ